MNTFTITGYNKTTGIITFNSTFEGTTYTGITASGCPKTSVEDVKAFMLAYMKAYVAGKAIEAEKVSDIPAEVKALLNTPTNFE